MMGFIELVVFFFPWLYFDEFATSWMNSEGKNLGLTVQMLTDLLDTETG